MQWYHPVPLWSFMLVYFAALDFAISNGAAKVVRVDGLGLRSRCPSADVVVFILPFDFYFYI